MGFEELTKRISPKLNAVTHKLNGRYLFFNEDDLYQEALLHLWLEYNKGNLSDKTDSFIVQNCFFFLKNHIRKIYKKIDINSIRLSDFMENEDGAGTFESLLSSEDRVCGTDFSNSEVALEDMRGRLSQRENEVLTLCLDGLTTREIGAKLGVSHVMVIKIEKKIRQKCKKFKEEIKN